MATTQQSEQPAHVPRPLPVPTSLTRLFWDACKRGELLFQRCTRCGQSIFPPQAFCPHDLDTALSWERAGGIGIVYSFTIVERPQTPAFDVPYVVGIVELEEGYLMMTNIVDCAPEEVKIGMPVEVRYEAQSDEITLPFFRPRQ